MITLLIKGWAVNRIRNRISCPSAVVHTAFTYNAFCLVLCLLFLQGRQPLPMNHSSLQPTPGGNLHITHPTADDAGIYSCTATSPVGYASREIQLSINSKQINVGLCRFLTSCLVIQYRLITKATSYYYFLHSSPAMPRIMGVSGHDNVVKMAAEVGTEVVLPCEAQGSPTPLVIWSRNGHPIPPVTAG